MPGWEFVERAAHERGFARAYADRIAPFLRGMEDERRAARARGRRRALMVLVPGAAAVAAFLLWADPDAAPWFAGFAAILTLVLCGAAFALSGAGFDAKVAAHVRPVLLEATGGPEWRETPSLGFVDASAFARLGLVRPFNRAKLSRGLSGTTNGAPWRVCHATLTSERGTGSDKRTSTVFAGLVLSVETPGCMPTVVFHTDRDDDGALLQAVKDVVAPRGRGMERLHFPDPEVEAVFDVWTDDPDRARQVLGPEFGRVLIEIGRQTQDGRPHLAAAFHGRAFLAAVRTTEAWMDLGAYDTPLEDYDVKARKALADLHLAPRIVARLTGGAEA